MYFGFGASSLEEDIIEGGVSGDLFIIQGDRDLLLSNPEPELPTMTTTDRDKDPDLTVVSKKTCFVCFCWGI